MGKDLRHAARLLLKTPTFTIIAVFTLALGIGATTAVFSAASAVLMKSLPFEEPDRLVHFGTMSAADLDDMRKQSQTFESVAVYQATNRNLHGSPFAERVAVVMGERSLFDVLGVSAASGRTFRADDTPDVAVVSQGFWQRRLAGSDTPAVTLDGRSFTVIGVMAPGFQFPYRTVLTDIWIPTELSGTENRARRVDAAVGRLRAGVTFEQAQAELQTMTAAGVVPIAALDESITGRWRTPLLTLLGAVAMVLLMACANVTNLLLVRAESRKHEIAVQTALGATRFRLIRQFLAESLLLSTMGSLAALAVAIGGIRLIRVLAATRIPHAPDIGLDWRVFLFLLVVSVVVAIGFGLVPALSASRANPGSVVLHQTSRQQSGTRRSRMIGDSLVVAEIALALVLLVGAGLLFRAFLSLRELPLGFAVDNVLTLRIEAGAAPAPGSHFREIEARVREIPGVRAAGFTTALPLQSGGATGTFSIPGHAADPAARNLSASLRFVTPEYFRALGIPLRRGRLFTDQEPGSAAPLVVNETFVRRYLPSGDPIGRVLDRGTIVGVIGDVRHSFAVDPTPEIYSNLLRAGYSNATLTVSADGTLEPFIPRIRNALRAVDPNQAAYNIKSMRQVLTEAYPDLSLNLWLIGSFAGLALVLGTMGIYGVMSYAVAAQRREFGIRMALGADAARVLSLVLRDGLRLLAFGWLIGMGGALALTRLLGAVLYGITPTDAPTLLAVSGILCAASIAACMIPARRAIRVDPALVLRAT